ncbi:MAG: type II toxin-antitoxin system death-on-curing family toxin [Dialister invisus]|jgi:death-on-curing family protein|uniref:type II toxin-antitoxin system death-on-curing family toxin n=1 Tax=Dialister invisus TaxID=218538 RepID=UPI003A4E99CF
MIIYPTAPAIIDIHNSVIKKSGGLAGVKDIGQLESVLAHIQNPDYYPTFLDQITHLVYSIAKFHIFNDGNKRSAILSGALFLTLNNYDRSMDLFVRGMEVPIIEAVTNHITKDELKDIIGIILSDN